MDAERRLIGRRVAAVSAIERPGDYCGPVMGHHHVDPSQDRPSVLFLLPNARDEDAQPGQRSIHRVASPPHLFRECDDGSLEIRESIGAGGLRSGAGFIWHGYLDEGHVWREV